MSKNPKENKSQRSHLAPWLPPFHTEAGARTAESVQVSVSLKASAPASQGRRRGAGRPRSPALRTGRLLSRGDVLHFLLSVPCNDGNASAPFLDWFRTRGGRETFTAPPTPIETPPLAPPWRFIGQRTLLFIASWNPLFSCTYSGYY